MGRFIETGSSMKPRLAHNSKPPPTTQMMRQPPCSTTSGQIQVVFFFLLHRKRPFGVCLSVLFFETRSRYSLFQPQTCYVARDVLDVLELLFLPTPPLQCWDSGSGHSLLPCARVLSLSFSLFFSLSLTSNILPGKLETWEKWHFENQLQNL